MYFCDLYLDEWQIFLALTCRADPSRWGSLSGPGVRSHPLPRSFCSVHRWKSYHRGSCRNWKVEKTNLVWDEDISLFRGKKNNPKNKQEQLKKRYPTTSRSTNNVWKSNTPPHKKKGFFSWKTLLSKHYWIQVYDSGDKKENCVYIFKLNNKTNISL